MSKIQTQEAIDRLATLATKLNKFKFEFKGKTGTLEQHLTDITIGTNFLLKDSGRINETDQIYSKNEINSINAISNNQIETNRQSIDGLSTLIDQLTITANNALNGANDWLSEKPNVAKISDIESAIKVNLGNLPITKTSNNNYKVDLSSIDMSKFQNGKKIEVKINNGTKSIFFEDSYNDGSSTDETKPIDGKDKDFTVTISDSEINFVSSLGGEESDFLSYEGNYLEQLGATAGSSIDPVARQEALDAKNLATSNKTEIDANIQKINTNASKIINKQDSTDINLETSSKNVVGAINELNEREETPLINSIQENKIFAAAPNVGNTVVCVVDDPANNGSKDVYQLINKEKLSNQAIYDVKKSHFAGVDHITESFFTECNETDTNNATMIPYPELDENSTGNEVTLWKSVKDKLFARVVKSNDAITYVLESPDKSVLFSFVLRNDGEIAIQGSGKINGVPVQMGLGTFDTGAGDKEVALLYTTIENGQPKQNFIPLSDIHNPGLGVAIAKDNERFREGVVEEFLKEILNKPGEAKEMWTRNSDGTYIIDNDWQSNGSLLGSTFLDITLLNDAVKVSSTAPGGTPAKVYINGNSISVSKNPIKAMEIATKHYADSSINPNTGKTRRVIDKILLDETKTIDFIKKTDQQGIIRFEDTTFPYLGAGDYSKATIIMFKIRVQFSNKKGDIYDQFFYPEFKLEGTDWVINNGETIEMQAINGGKVLSNAVIAFSTANINFGNKQAFLNFNQGTTLPETADGAWTGYISELILIEEAGNIAPPIPGLTVSTDINTGEREFTFTEPNNTSDFKIRMTDNKVSSIKMNAQGSTFEIASDANGKFDIKSKDLTINRKSAINFIDVIETGNEFIIGLFNKKLLPIFAVSDGDNGSYITFLSKTNTKFAVEPQDDGNYNIFSPNLTINGNKLPNGYEDMEITFDDGTTTTKKVGI